MIKLYSLDHLKSIAMELEDKFDELVDWSVHNDDTGLDQLNQWITDFKELKKTLYEE